ncbi:MAG: sigma-70 family RNA polymerase sigma factor [Woeseiaceae bacterium]|nr:sigma-70 family RNA polymerase sigma factor [Woeseiaceae bacterium]
MAMVYRNMDEGELPDTAQSSESDGTDREDLELVDCLRAGENRCYELFVRRFGPKVLAIARRYLRSIADADDCFQDTFMAIFDNIGTFEQRSSLGTWVRGVTVKQCLMRIRAAGRRREESIEHLLPEFDAHGSRVQTDHANRASGFGEALDESRLRLFVRAKIDDLPDDYRITLLLRDIDGYSTRETADILGIQVNAVKTRLHRARSALRSLLEPELEQLY